MESAADTSKNLSASQEGFFKHMTSFDDESKCQVMNMIQFAILSIIPGILILKAIKHFIPEEDESKGTLEITAECVGQIALLLLAIWFSDRAIRYVPTYSDCEYLKFDPYSMILPLIILMLTMQTKLGAKISILIDRAVEAWGGKQEDVSRPKNSGKVIVSQPLAGQHYPSQADSLDQSQLLPSMPGMTGMPQQQSPDFNQMYQNNVTPMPGAATPGEGMGMMMDQGPMAANAALGGSFSNW